MPWLYNPDRNAVQIVKGDGSVGSLPGRTKVYIEPSNMSADIGRLVQSRKLINRGGDPVKEEPVKAPNTGEMENTSSSIHPATGIVTSDHQSDDLSITSWHTQISYTDDVLVSEGDDQEVADNEEESGGAGDSHGKRRKRRRR